MVDISAEVTKTFPTTEGKLAGDSTVDYVTQKATAITRAKRSLYAHRTIPANEAEIPEQAAYWIADQAVVFLIPVAIDWYMNHTRLSDSVEGATLSYHNTVATLERLRTELEANMVVNRQAATEACDTAWHEEDVPAVSVAGMAIDPLARAMSRGPLF